MTLIISHEDIADLLSDAHESAKAGALLHLFGHPSFMREVLGRLFSLAANIHFKNGEEFTYKDTIDRLIGALATDEKVSAEYIIHELYLNIRKLVYNQIDIGGLFDIEAIDERFGVQGMWCPPVRGFRLIPLVSARTIEQYPDMVNIDGLIEWLHSRDF